MKGKVNKRKIDFEELVARAEEFLKEGVKLLPYFFI